MNLMMLLQMAADGFGDRQAIGDKSGGMTYAELYQKAGATAALLREKNVKSVGYVDINTPTLPVALFAAAWAGCPFVPLNYRLTDLELADMAEQICPALMIAGDDYYPKLENIQDLNLLKTTELSEATNKNENKNGNENPADWNSDPEKEAILLYTSGTTGKPKAAVLRHKHIVSYVLGSQEFMSAGEEEATLIAVPPYHIAGMSAISTAVYAGRRIVQLASFSPDAWIQTAKKESITHAMLVPTMLWRIVEELDKANDTISSIRTISYGGGKMPVDVIGKALDILPNTDFVNAYGMTETSSTISILGPDEHRKALKAKSPAARQRLVSVGKPLPSMELTIRDENGDPVPPNTHGEIWVRGEQVSGEYKGHKSRVTQDGWFPTNDGGWLDKEGYLFVDGRLDDVIVRGGENISPGEIEDILRSHPAILDVAAFGTPDTEWGEAITVAVAKKTAITKEEVQEYVRQNLRSSKVPDRVEFVDEIPYNETGKLLRRKLKDALK